MAKTRGAHSFRPRVRQGPTPPTGTSTPGPSSAVAAPSTAAAGADPNMPAASPSVVAASPAPAAVQSPAAGDAEDSSSVAPAQRRYHTRGWAHSTRFFASQASPEGPTGQEGLDFRLKRVIHFEIKGATLSTLSGYCRSPRFISGIHHQAALLPLRPHPEEC